MHTYKIVKLYSKRQEEKEENIPELSRGRCICMFSIESVVCCTSMSPEEYDVTSCVSCGDIGGGGGKSSGSSIVGIEAGLVGVTGVICCGGELISGSSTLLCTSP